MKIPDITVSLIESGWLLCFKCCKKYFVAILPGINYTVNVSLQDDGGIEYGKAEETDRSGE